MKHVRLKFKLGDKVLSLGDCHPAQARLMVQKELASWDNGELLLLLRPAHSDLLDHDPEHLIGPAYDSNVSKAELDRRLVWFKWFLEKSTKALSTVGQPGGSWEETVRTADLDLQERLQYLATDFSLEDTMTEEEVAAFFAEEAASEDSGKPEELAAIWESDFEQETWNKFVRGEGEPGYIAPVGDTPAGEDISCLTGEPLGEATMSKVQKAYRLKAPDLYTGPGVSPKAVEPQDAQPLARQFKFIVPCRKTPEPDPAT